MLALIPDGAGAWYEPLLDERLSFDDVFSRSALSLRREGFDDLWAVEELVQHPDDPLRPVDDVKLCFVGDRFVCGFVRTHRPRAFRWFDHNLDDIDPGVHSAQMSADVALPANLEELIGAARRISAGIPLPIFRVDLYASADGPVIGELTPLPGWYAMLTDEWDRLLGELVEAEESRLCRSGMRWASLATGPVARAAAAS